jgi:lipid-A-disaccharide synthase
MRLFITAGEPSGDHLGGALLQALRTLDPTLQARGVGGPAMAARGVASLFSQSDLAVMGLAEVLPRLALLLRRIDETAQAIAADPPDVVVTIDSPDFSFRVAKRARNLLGAHTTVKFIHYVAPSVWAWRPGRAAKMAQFLDRVLCLLPFEPPYFERVGLSARFVGHPLAAKPHLPRTDHTDAPTLCLLPGSRRGEITRHLPIFLDTLATLRRHRPALRAVLPTLPHLEAQIAAIVKGQADIVADRARHDACFAASTAALSASGTVTLEVALAHLPQVIAYRVNPLTAAIARRLIRVTHVGLPNLVLGREIAPERLQERCTPRDLAAALAPLLDDPVARASQVQAAGEMRTALLPSGGDPARAAAEAVLDLLG